MIGVLWRKNPFMKVVRFATPVKGWKYRRC